MTSPPQYELKTQLDTPARKVIAQSYPTDSPVVSVIVKKKHKHHIHKLSHSLKTLG
jgi:hypothetical protein